MEKTPLLHQDITDKILHVFYKQVYHKLGYGFTKALSWAITRLIWLSKTV
jgi:hypothetical protein